MGIITERTNLHNVDNPEEMFSGELSSPTRVYHHNLHVLAAMITSHLGRPVSSHSQLEHAGSLDNDGT